MFPTSILLALFAVSAAVALAAADGRQQMVFNVAKPLTTLLLFFVAGFPAEGTFGTLVAAGLAMSVFGDIALLDDRRLPFVVGLGCFLVTHVLYTVAFGYLAGTVPLRITMLSLAMFAGCTTWLVRRLWPGVPQGLQITVLIYGGCITLMIGYAQFLWWGLQPALIVCAITTGALLFYVADAVLAWHLFRQKLRFGQSLNLSAYWAGQCLIALGGRWAMDL